MHTYVDWEKNRLNTLSNFIYVNNSMATRYNCMKLSTKYVKLFNTIIQWISILEISLCMTWSKILQNNCYSICTYILLFYYIVSI